MIYGIVGNRKGWTFGYVKSMLKNIGIGSGDILVSGGAQGVDTYAEQYARQVGAEMWILFPDPKEPLPDRYMDRNKEIARRCETLVAFDKGSCERTGTASTINFARRLGKEVILFD